MEKKTEYYIEKLNLQKHPEGGYYKEIYRSDDIITVTNLPLRFGGNRNISTSIFYMLEKTDISVFHRIKSDEIWHFYKGTTLEIYDIDEKGFLKKHLLGDQLEKDEHLQIVIKKGHWFAAGLQNKKSFTLVGCTVAPGFDFDDFELGEREKLLHIFPHHKAIIKSFTRE